MFTVSTPPAIVQPAEYVVRDSSHADECVTPAVPQHDDSSIEALHHAQAIDCGDDAVMADIAGAEATIRSRIEFLERIDIERQVRRVWKPDGVRNEVEWSVAIVEEFRPMVVGSDAELDVAVAMALSKLTAPNTAA